MDDVHINNQSIVDLLNVAFSDVTKPNLHDALIPNGLNMYGINTDGSYQKGTEFTFEISRAHSTDELRSIHDFGLSCFLVYLSVSGYHYYVPRLLLSIHSQNDQSDAELIKHLSELIDLGAHRPRTQKEEFELFLAGLSRAQLEVLQLSFALIGCSIDMLLGFHGPYKLAVNYIEELLMAKS